MLNSALSSILDLAASNPAASEISEPFISPNISENSTETESIRLLALELSSL